MNMEDDDTDLTWYLITLALMMIALSGIIGLALGNMDLRVAPCDRCYIGNRPVEPLKVDGDRLSRHPCAGDALMDVTGAHTMHLVGHHDTMRYAGIIPSHVGHRVKIVNHGPGDVSFQGPGECNERVVNYDAYFTPGGVAIATYDGLKWTFASEDAEMSTDVGTD